MPLYELRFRVRGRRAVIVTETLPEQDTVLTYLETQIEDPASPLEPQDAAFLLNHFRINRVPPVGEGDAFLAIQLRSTCSPSDTSP